MYILQRSAEQLVFRKYATPLPIMTVMLASLMGMCFMTMLWSGIATLLDAADMEGLGLGAFYLFCAYVFGLATWHSFNQQEIAHYIIDKTQNSLFERAYYLLPLPIKLQKRCALDAIQRVEVWEEVDSMAAPQEYLLILHLAGAETLELSSRFAVSEKDLLQIQAGMREVVTFLGFEMVVQRKIQ